LQAKGIAEEKSVLKKFNCDISETTIGQRLGSPEFQPSESIDLYPRHKHLLIRRSLRCKVSPVFYHRYYYTEFKSNVNNKKIHVTAWLIICDKISIVIKS
jgi:dynactin-4